MQPGRRKKRARQRLLRNPETKANAQPTVRGVGPREGVRSDPPASKSLLMELAGSRTGPAFASWSGSRPWSRWSPRSDFSPSESLRDDDRHATRAPVGLCHLVNEWHPHEVLGRPLRPNRAETLEVESASRNAGGVTDPMNGTTARGSVRGYASEQKVENAALNVAFDGVTPIGRSVHSVAGLSPARHGSTLGLCSKRQLRFECLDHRGRSTAVGSRQKVSPAVKAELEPSRVARRKRP